MTGHAQLSGAARHRAAAGASLAVAGAALAMVSALVLLLLTARIAWGSQAAPEYGAANAAGTYQVALQVGAAPFTYTLPAGSSVTLPISASVTGPQGLAAASVLVQYDTGQLRPTACVRRAGGPSGHCNADYDRASGLVRFNILSQTGVIGDATLFDLTFEAASSATIHREVVVTPLVASLTDLHGNYMASRAWGSTVRIEEPAGSGTIVFVGAPEQTEPFAVTRGLTVTVPIWVTGPAAGADALGTATFSLSFDAGVVRAVACQSVQSADGGASGACAVHADHVRANLMAPGGINSPAVAFQAIFTAADGAPEGGSSPLTLILESFKDASGAPLAARVSNNALVVSDAAGPGAPVLRLEPSDQGIEGDGPATVHLFLSAGTRLAAGSWGVRYDPRLLQVAACRPSAELLSAICNPDGEPGLVRMAVLAGEPLPATADLGTITWRRHPDAQAGATAPLTFSVTNFADLRGTPLPYATRGAAIRITSAPGANPAVVVRLQGAPVGGYQLPRGASLELPISFAIDAALPVGNLSGTLRYDPQVLRATRCLRSSAALPETPVGYCNVQDTAAGLVRFNLVATEGVSGVLTPFTLTVEAASAATDGQASLLDLDLDSVAGPSGAARGWRAEDNSVLLQSPISAAGVLIGPPPPETDAIYQLGAGLTTTSVPLWVAAVDGLGAATVSVRYDAAIARAVKCSVRSDLTPALDGGFCALLAGKVRMAFMSSGGVSGAAHIFDIVFADAPNVVGGESTALAVDVESFVDTASIPIPTTVRAGRLDITACNLRPLALSIALPDHAVVLTWPHITLDTCGEAMQVTDYEIWPDRTLYTMPTSAPIGHIRVPPGTPDTAVFSFPLEPPTPEAGLAIYRVVAVAADGRRSALSDLQSDTKAAFTYRLAPGLPAVR